MVAPATRHLRDGSASAAVKKSARFGALVTQCRAMRRRRPSEFLHLQLGAATYEFRRCYRALPWNSVAGLYCFVAWPGYRLLYIGETGCFASRLPAHEVWPLARQQGATEIYAMPFAGTSVERRRVERALIGAYAPPCNTPVSYTHLTLPTN